LSEAPRGEGHAPGNPAALRGQRLMLGVALALLTALLVIAARTEQGSAPTGDRIGRQLELTELIMQEQERTEQLEQRVEELSTEIARYETTAVAGSAVLADLQAQVEAVEAPAGLTDVEGTGLVVTLEDSSRGFDPGRVDPNSLVIHETDLRAVVNALFAGGAEAVSINDSRVLSTTGIRCVGNTLYLNGRLYAPPFVIRAVGDPFELGNALDRDPAVENFRRVAAEFDLGYDVAEAESLRIPAHSGLSGLEAAVPAADR
jgi:uncharacterized protein YlxW (UPF0749 family)